MVLVVVTRFRNLSEHGFADVVTSLAGLLQGFAQLVEAQSLDLDVHLACCDAVGRACHLEVHVSEVVLVAEDVREDGVLPRFEVGDQAHRDA